MKSLEDDIFLPNKIQQSLLDHTDLQSAISKLVSYFKKVYTVKGLIVSGSVATGDVDQFSDIDLLAIVSNDGMRETWLKRYNIEASVGTVIFRIDLDEIWPTSAVSFYKNGVKVHITYKTISELEVEEEFRNGIILFSNESKIDQWLEKCITTPINIDLSQLLNNDRRFWFWLLQGAAKFGRGEFWAAYDTLYILRSIIIYAHETANKRPFQSFRRIEDRWENVELSELTETISGIDHRKLSVAYIKTLRLYEKIRKEAKTNLKIKWDVASESLNFVKSTVNRWINENHNQN